MSNSDFICESCGNQYKSSFALTRHCKISKYCKVIYTLKNENNELKSENNELKKKIDNLQHLLQQKEEKLTDLYERMTDTVIDMSKTPKYVSNSTNNNNNRIVIQNCLTDDRILSAISKIDMNSIHNGAFGYSNWAFDNFLHDTVKFTDVSRHKLIWKNEDNEIIKDTHGAKLCKKIFKATKEHNTNLVKNYINECDAYIKTCDNQFEIQQMFDTMSNITKTISSCSDIANGEINNFLKEFLKHLAVRL